MPRTPNTKVQFFNVPWDSDYRNLRYFSSKSARDSWFNNRSHITYPDDSVFQIRDGVKHAQTYVYGNAYTVSTNWDNMNGYNYMRFKNSQYPQGEWHYCFITGWKGVSEHSCEFTAVRDAYIDNVEKLKFPKTYVERCHSTGDNITYTPEPITINRYVYKGKGGLIHSGGKMKYIIISSKDFDGEEWKQHPCVIDGVDYNLFLYATANYDQFNGWLKRFSKDGIQIMSAYAIPSNFCHINSTNSIQFLELGGNVKRDTGNYKPKNKKCLIYPYCYCVVSNYQNASRTYKWEDGNNGQLDFKADGCCNPGGVVNLKPAFKYSNTTYLENLTNSITFPIGYSQDGFAMWSAQNQSQIKSQNVSNAISAVTSVASVLGGAVTIGASGGSMMPVGAGLISAGIGMGGQIGQTANAVSTAQESAKYTPNPATMPDGAIQYLATRNILGFHAYAVYPSSSEFRELDDFFTRYGYSQGRILSINPNRRSAFWYVKTQGATVLGSAPQQDRNILAQCLDRGVTFWHNDNIGDYSQTNT